MTTRDLELLKESLRIQPGILLVRHVMGAARRLDLACFGEKDRLDLVVFCHAQNGQIHGTRRTVTAPISKFNGPPKRRKSRKR